MLFQILKANLGVCFSIPFFIFSLHTYAFINVESIRQIKGKGFIGSSALQTAGQMGNTEKITSQLTTIGAWRLDANEWLYSGNYKYGSSSKVKDTHLGIAHLRHTWGYLNPLAFEMFVQSEFNQFKELNSRHFIGGNLRWRLKQTETLNLFFGSGLFYELEDFYQFDRDEKKVRANLYLSYVQNMNKQVSSFATVYYQPVVNDFHNHRVRLQSGIDIKLNSLLSFGLSFNINHDAQVPQGVKQTDMDYLVGLGIKY